MRVECITAMMLVTTMRAESDSSVHTNCVHVNDSLLSCTPSEADRDGVTSPSAPP